jgi:hypothetical protein
MVLRRHRFQPQQPSNTSSSLVVVGELTMVVVVQEVIVLPRDLLLLWQLLTRSRLVLVGWVLKVQAHLETAMRLCLLQLPRLVVAVVEVLIMLMGTAVALEEAGVMMQMEVRGIHQPHLHRRAIAVETG